MSKPWPPKKFVVMDKVHAVRAEPEEPSGTFGITRCGVKFKPVLPRLQTATVTCQRCRKARRTR